MIVFCLKVTNFLLSQVLLHITKRNLLNAIVCRYPMAKNHSTIVNKVMRTQKGGAAAPEIIGSARCRCLQRALRSFAAHAANCEKSTFTPQKQCFYPAKEAFLPRKSTILTIVQALLSCCSSRKCLCAVCLTAAHRQSFVPEGRRYGCLTRVRQLHQYP